MNGRMNKYELLELLKTLKVDVEEFFILSSSALVVREIYPDAGDLDIAVTDRGLEELKKYYNLKFKDNGWFILNDKIEGVCEGAKDMLKYQPEKIGEYYVQNINEYYHLQLCHSEHHRMSAHLQLHPIVSYAYRVIVYLGNRFYRALIYDDL